MAENYEIDPEEQENLRALIMAGVIGDDHQFECNVDTDDHLHIRRVGQPGSGLKGRVAIMAHSGDREPSVVYFAAAQVRAIAAALLNAADDLDGDTPLVFMPDDD